MILWIYLCIVGTEVVPFKLGATSKGREGAETEFTKEQGLDTLTKPDGEGKVIEQQHKGSDGGSPLKSPAGGDDERANVLAGGEKKQKGRSKNWTRPNQQTLRALYKVAPRPGPVLFFQMMFSEVSSYSKSLV
jgi:hypothetical protein